MNPGIGTVKKLGFWSAILALLFSTAYIVAQLAEWSGLLGPRGGPLSLTFLMAPSLFLAVWFIILMVSIHYYAPEEKKIWSHTGLAFAVIYAVLVSIVYFVQLTVVVPHLLLGEADQIPFLIFTPFDSFLYAVDILGYGFMSLATLFTAPVFANGRLERWTRRFLVANGLLVLPITLQMFFPMLLYVAALWALTFPVSMILLAVLFRRLSRW